MKTSKEFKEKLHNGVISSSMLEAALYSVNKRAKNYRDKEREIKNSYGKYSKYAMTPHAKKEMFYRKKEELLGIVKPICIHQEFAGFARERIYSYDKGYEDMRFYAWMHALICWANSYYDYDYDGEVVFFDQIDPSAPTFRYYLYYCVGSHTFHSLIESPDDYSGLPIHKIDTITTFGDDYKDLMSVQFVDKLLEVIRSGQFTYEEDIPAVMPYFPAFDLEKHHPERPAWPSVWAELKSSITDYCEKRIIPQIPDEEIEEMLRGTAFNFHGIHLSDNRGRLKSKRNKKKNIPWIKVTGGSVSLPDPDFSDEIQDSMAIADTFCTGKKEYAAFLCKEDSPIYQEIYEYSQKCACVKFVKNRLSEIISGLKDDGADFPSIEAKVWGIFKEKYSDYVSNL